MGEGRLGDQLDVTRACFVVIHDTWVGMNPHSPIAAVDELRRGTRGALSGEGRLSTAIAGDLGEKSGLALLFTQSQGEFHAPWAACIGGRMFSIPGEEIGKALAALRTPLKRATLERMLKQTKRRGR